MHTLQHHTRPLQRVGTSGPKLDRVPGRTTRRNLGVCALLIALIAATPVAGSPPSFPLVEDPIGAPMRVRDFTFPSYLVLSFPPQPAAPLGRGRHALEFHASRVNDFQVGPEVERYLEQTRGGTPRALDAQDASFITSLPEGLGYFIDGEFSFYDFVGHYGLTDRLDIGLSAYYIDYSGGFFDGPIMEFHHALGFGQQGREFVPEGQFQVVIGTEGVELIRLDGPPPGGWSDVGVFLRYALPGAGRWGFNMALGIKPPVASPGPLSSGSWDHGMVVTADRRWRCHALLVNLAIVEPGRFEALGFDPPILPSLNVAWLHRLSRFPDTRFMVQALVAEHPFRDAIGSDISDPELQLLMGVKWHTAAGVLGIGLTENLANYDNTPDVGLHLSWGWLSP